MIRTNDKIQGIRINNTEFKIGQFADDTTLFVSSSESAREALRSIETFSKYSGLKLNMKKSKAMALGCGYTEEEPPFTAADLESVSKVHILGMWFSRNRSLEDHYNWNFSTQIAKMAAACKSWSNRTLSLKGKVTVYNTLVLSLLQYIIANSITPPRVLAEVKRMACSFLWSGKTNKIAYATVIQSVKEGGLRLMDLEVRCKTNRIAWIRRALLAPCSAAESLKLLMKEQNLTLIIGTKRNFPPGLASRAPFYAEALSE